MKLKLIHIIVLLITSTILKSQDFIDFNTGENRTKKILLVPFDPRIYLNDATAIIAQKDGGTHDEIMEYFRYQFNLQLYNSMIDSCTIISLYSDNTRQDQDDINELYSIISYELKLAMENPEENPDDERKGLLEKRKAEKAKQQRIEEASEYKTHIKDGELVGRRQPVNDMFLNIVFHQPEVLKEIAIKRNVDYFLFINHFEISGNYGDPYMSGNSNATRTIKVHFSLYNTDVLLIHGGFGENKIPFSLDDKREIVALYFPEVIRQIIRNIDF